MLYTRRLDSPREIRLLRLHARSTPSQKLSSDVEENVPISCDLYPVKFQDAKKQGYQALSYTWGDSTAPLPILVNKMEVFVWKNLHGVLEHFSRETEDIILWVDALCINQEDDEEKGEQVQIMTSIYESARSTRIWLGPADDTSEDIITRLGEIGKLVIDRGAFDNFVRAIADWVKNPESAKEAEERAMALIEDVFKKALLELQDSIRLLKGCRSLLSRPYWSRVWILQEFVVSCNIEIYCGNPKIGFRELHAAILYITSMRNVLSAELLKKLTKILEDRGDGEYPPDGELKAHFDAINSLDIPLSASLVSGMRYRYHEPAQKSSGAEPNLLQLLARTHTGRQAGEPKDKIWALLGMAADTKVLGLVPKYDKAESCADVYCKATRAIITAGHVDILAFCRRSMTAPDIAPSTKPEITADNTPGVPSWVPEWRKDVNQPFGQVPWDTPYSVSGSAKLSKHLDQTGPLSTLKIAGFPVDSIELLKMQCNEGKWLSMQDRIPACKYLLDIMNLCEISNTKLKQRGEEIYPDPLQREGAYQRVPVADLFFRGLIRRATVDECHVGHAEVIADYTTRLQLGPEHGSTFTDTFRSYYIMMAQQVERRPFVTVKGFVGLAPADTKEGDIIVVFPGARFPYVLRECEEGKYVLVGEAFVHGIMYGELVIKESELQEFVLT